MLNYIIRMLFSAVCFACFFLALTSGAYAQTAEELKQSGLAGERPDGYLGIVNFSASESIRTSVTNINQKRRAHYNVVAEKNDTTVLVVERIFGEKLINRALSGEFVLNESGEWKQK